MRKVKIPIVILGHKIPSIDQVYAEMLKCQGILLLQTIEEMQDKMNDILKQEKERFPTNDIIELRKLPKTPKQIEVQESYKTPKQYGQSLKRNRRK